MTAPGFIATFGGTAIFPSQPSYRAVALSTDTTLAWPTEVATDDNVVAALMDVTPSGGGLTLTMPPANETTLGNGAVIVNRGASTFTVARNDGTTITTVAAGEAWSVWIVTNATAAGTWASVQYGAGVSSANAGALAGFGIKAIATTLNQSMPNTAVTTDYIVGLTDRAKVINWTGGAGTVTLPAAADAGTDWFTYIRDSGSGSIVITPPGSENINGTSTLTINPGDSCAVWTDGTDFFTQGLGQASEFPFSYVSISLTGQPSPYVLSGAELNQIGYNFGGALGTDMSIEVPATVQQYWVTNSTTGAHTLTVRIHGSTGTVVTQGASAILYSNGADVVAADTNPISVPLTVPQGGTGNVSWTVGGLLYAPTTTTLANGSQFVFDGNSLGLGNVATVDRGINMLFTGASSLNQYGIFMDMIGSAAATTLIAGVRLRVRTVAASFTCDLATALMIADGAVGAGSAITTQVGVFIDDLTVGTNNRALDLRVSAGTNKYNIYSGGTAANYFAGDVQFDKTITTGGTTGAQTINKNAGSVNFAASAASLVVTNSRVTANSIVIVTVATNDATMKSASAVSTAGSFTLRGNAVPTAETRVNFIVVN